MNPTVIRLIKVGTLVGKHPTGDCSVFRIIPDRAKSFLTALKGSITNLVTDGSLSLGEPIICWTEIIARAKVAKPVLNLRD